MRLPTIGSFAMLALSSCSCSLLGPASDAADVALTADDLLAQVLCAEAAAVEKRVSVEDAIDAYCSEREQWRPFLEAAAELREREQYRRAVGRD